MGRGSSYHFFVLSNVIFVFVTQFDRSWCISPEVIKQELKETLGLNKTPNVFKMNVSQENYAKMVNLYIRRRKKAEAEIHQPIARRFYTLSPSRTEYEANNRLKFHFNDKRFKDFKVEGMTFRMFLSDDEIDYDQSMRLSVTDERGNRIDYKEIPGGLLPKWVDVYVMEKHKKMGKVVLKVDCGPTCFIKRPTLNIFKHKSHIGLDPRRNSKRRRRSKRQIRKDRFRGSPGSDLEKYINFTEGPVPRTDCTHLDPDNKHLCCRQRYEIPFRLTPGFEWILQPFSYDIGKCSGECPQRYNPTGYHATIHTILNQLGLVKHKSCCVPASLKDIEILYLDDEDETRLKVANWHSLKATECSCS